MKTQLVNVIVILGIILITGCSSAQSKDLLNKHIIQEKSSFVLKNIQFERWVSGIQGEGSGYQIYMSVLENRNHVNFDSIYFKGYSAKIKVGKMGYFASIQTPENHKKNMIMSGEKGDEYGNIPKIMPDKQYDFGANTCVIRYLENDQIFYYKFNQMEARQQKNDPSSSLNNE